MLAFNVAIHISWAWGASRVASAKGRVVCCTLELMQILPPDPLSCIIVLTLSHKTAEMKNGSLSELNTLEIHPWSMLPQEAVLESGFMQLGEAMLMFMIHVASAGLLVSMIHATTICYEQGSFCSTINDCELITEIERYWRLLLQPLPQHPTSGKRNSPDRKLLKRNFFKNCDKDAEVHKSGGEGVPEKMWKWILWSGFMIKFPNNK